jgi:hypothetical protein
VRQRVTRAQLAMTSRATGDFMFEVVKENNRNRQSACLFSLHADSGFGKADAARFTHHPAPGDHN